MLLLAPTEISSITIYLLGAVSVKALYLIGKREKILSKEKTVEESTRKSERHTGQSNHHKQLSQSLAHNTF